jgi:hypothetical protein
LIDSSCITTDFGAERPGDDTGESIVEHLAGVDDFEVAEATYRAAVARWPMLTEDWYYSRASVRPCHALGCGGDDHLPWNCFYFFVTTPRSFFAR